MNNSFIIIETSLCLVVFCIVKITRGSLKKKEMSNMIRKDEVDKPTIAPGMDDQEELEQNATQEEMNKGEYTEVTTLSYDEVEQS